MIVLSIDGFRYNYLNLFPKYLPTLVDMRERGVYIDQLKPSFPTKTFPNHYTIATGQFVESHGIVSNSFMGENNQIFTQPRTEPEWWEQGEPIWITAAKQNVSR